MSNREVKLLIEDMIEIAEIIITYTTNFSFEDFIKDRRTQDAVIRNFEIIGEAGNRLSVEFKKEHPQIDWNRIRGLRNRVVHDYFGIDYSIVWAIRTQFLPSFIQALKRIDFNAD